MNMHQLIGGDHLQDLAQWLPDGEAEDCDSVGFEPGYDRGDVVLARRGTGG